MQPGDETQRALIVWSEESALLTQSAAEWLAANSGFEAVRKLMATSSGFDARAYHELSQLGWLGVALPAQYGGAELGVSALTGLFEAMGQRLHAGPLLASTLAAQTLLRAGSEAQKSAWLPKIANGEAVATLALYEPHGSYLLSSVAASAQRSGTGFELRGVKAAVLDAQNADLVLVAARSEGELALFAIERAHLEGRVRVELAVDETRRSARISLDGLRLPTSARLGGDDPRAARAALEHTERLAWLLCAADAAGGAEGVMQLTLDYLRTRKQFGKPIGGYQALKHTMVEIMCLIEEGRGLLYHAATALEGGEADAELALRMAKAQLCETYAFAADRAIQFHGGMGFTHECHAQLFLRRAQQLSCTYGDALHHRQQLARLAFG